MLVVHVLVLRPAEGLAESTRVRLDDLIDRRRRPCCDLDTTSPRLADISVLDRIDVSLAVREQ